MIAVYIHGLGSDGEDQLLRTVSKYVPLQPVFVDYSVLYDKPGWPEDVLGVVKEQIPEEEHVLITHSFGGPIAAFLQNKYTKALVYIAPAFSVNMGLRFTLLAEAARKGHAYFEGKHGVWLRTADIHTIFRLMGKAPHPTVPFAIILGEEDMVIDNRAARKYFHHANERRSWFVEIAGAGHNFLEREEEVALVVRAFLGSLGISPSSQGFK